MNDIPLSHEKLKELHEQLQKNKETVTRTLCISRNKERYEKIHKELEEIEYMVPTNKTERAKLGRRITELQKIQENYSREDRNRRIILVNESDLNRLQQDFMKTIAMYDSLIAEMNITKK